MERTSSPAEDTRAGESDFLARARALRPFYFIVAVWGECYVDYLLNFCIASLLSPNNIPALANRGKNKFLFATTDEDWARMQPSPMFELLKQYCEPVFLRIPPRSPEVSNCAHMGIGHKLATQMAYEDGAYGVLLTPDMMLSDGSMAAAQRHAVNGVQVVLTAALRFGEEPLFEHLGKLGVATLDSRCADEARPLTVTGRQLVWAGIRSMHSETLRFEWDRPYLASCPSALWWRVPGEDGIIVHSLSWAPVIVDYGAMNAHDSSVMDQWTIDGDYIYRNFGLEGKVHIVQDSDEVMHISWTPLAQERKSLKGTLRFAIPVLGAWFKGAAFYDAFTSPTFDPLKRRIFPLPVYWHARELNQARWNRVQSTARDIIRRYGLQGGGTSRTVHRIDRSRIRLANAVLAALRCLNSLSHKARVALGHVARFVGLIVPAYLARVARFVCYYWDNRRHVFGLAGRALRGDFAAWNRIRRSFGFFVKLIRGKPNVYD